MNLMVNNYCNLHCPYCFAQEEMHSKKVMNITIENYKIFLDFLKKNDMDSVRAFLLKNNIKMMRSSELEKIIYTHLLWWTMIK